MIRNQRKMMMPSTTRNSQWREKQSKTKEYQNKGEIFQRTWKYHSTSIKPRKMKSLEKIMFSDQDAPLRLKVGSNHLILQNIMAHMNFSTLKAAREVSKDWKKLANLELGRRKCARFPLGRFLWCEKRSLRNSDDISWMEFDCQSMDLEDLNELDAVCGHQVKMLKLGPWYVSPWERSWNFLTPEKFPNLEILSFYPYTINNSISYNIFRPSKCESSANTILTSLQRIVISDAWLLPSKFLQDKGHLVKSANLDIWNCFGEDVALKYITELAESKPELERLKIGRGRDLSPEFGKQFHLLLKASRKSLQTLEISPSENYPFYFQPQLSQTYPRLLTFRLDIDVLSFSLKNQLESFSQDCFPNLKTVKLQIMHWTKEDLLDSLCSSPRERGRLTSVVNLEVNCQAMCDSPHDWVPWLSILYPHVQNLTIKVLKDTAEVFHHIFTLWPNLSSLSIHIHDSFSSGDKLDLDPLFTGLSLEKCQELKKYPKKMKLQMRKEILKDRTWPNLNSLKDLKRLDFTITGTFPRPFWFPVSLISFLYAINLQPKLKTTIRFPETVVGYRKFLKPFKPYAQLEDSHGHEWKF